MTQPTASSKTTASSNTTTDSSPDPAVCISPDEMSQYVAGWSDDQQSERIESHLATCPACERTLRGLEIKPDTLVQSLQRTAVDGSRNDGKNAAGQPAEPSIEAALAKARRLMDVSVEPTIPAWMVN